MRSDSGRTVSLWRATAKELSGSTLKSDARADVCVVGAGIAGLTTAYLLGREGRSVVVLDDGPIGGGNTERTTAHLSNAIDDRYFEIERLHGERGARIAAESHSAAIDTIERIVQEEGIDCDFERLDGYLFAPPRKSRKVLEDELKAAHRAGLERVERVKRAPIESFDTGSALRFPSQGQFHPMKYLNSLAELVRRDGGLIFTGGAAHAEEIQGGDDARVRTTGGYTVEARDIVVATNSPVNDRFEIHTKQAPYMTYVIGARIPGNSVPHALYWDTLDPYHYVRVQKAEDENSDYEILIIGGEDHKTGQEHDFSRRYSRLERWARFRFPQMREIEFRWSGMVFETIDGLAFIGRNPADEPNVYIATGDSGMGMTHGTIAGLLLTDLIMGRDNHWAEVYDPARKTLSALGEFAKENLNVAAQYADYVTPGEVDDESEVQPGEGALIRGGLTKTAVYRDEDGVVHRMSAVCVHLGCIVNWNTNEKTWDCPCHGSRYDQTGRVINGPANRDLDAVSDD
ncbi:MAG TPA: FAD-dependent oxidoreductase [Pyrinomonadaceae bacterium]|jgi:glycine/D-amino acid oxidase-like deaminating enzyme/nitrite reductase/ring-hydroxylating ferredoxin subunit